MTNITNVLLSPRFVSFYYRTGAFVVAGFCDILLQNISQLNLTPLSVTILGLVLGELSKALNNYLKGKPLGFAK